jgi:hypothetical protein
MHCQTGADDCDQGDDDEDNQTLVHFVSILLLRWGRMAGADETSSPFRHQQVIAQLVLFKLVCFVKNGTACRKKIRSSE